MVSPSTLFLLIFHRLHFFWYPLPSQLRFVSSFDHTFTLAQSYVHLIHFHPLCAHLKSRNVQLLYNMTENSLDHDNTITIALRLFGSLFRHHLRPSFLPVPSSPTRLHTSIASLLSHIINPFRRSFSSLLYASIIKHLCPLIVPRTTIQLLF